MRERLARGLRRAASGLFIAVAFAFLGAVVLRHREELVAFDWQVAPLRLIVSILALIGVLTAGVGIWRRILRRFGPRPSFHTMARLWFLSSLGRYIPGKIWQFVGLAELGRRYGIRPIVASTSLLVYMGFILLAAWFTGIYLIPREALGPLADAVGPLRIASPLLLVVLHPAILNTLVRWVSRLTRRPLEAWNGSWTTSFGLLGLCVLQWFGFGLAFHLFVGSLTPVTPLDYPALTGIYSLAFLAGYLVLIAPAGLGAKEGAMTALLGSIVPLPVAAAIAIAARLWNVAAEAPPALLLLRGAGAESESGARAEPRANSPIDPRAENTPDSERIPTDTGT